MNVINETFEGNTIIRGDTLTVLKSFPDKLFGGIITDPPYASGAVTQNRKQQSTAKKYSSFKDGCPFPDFEGDSKDQRGKTRFVLKPNLMQCCSKDYPVSFVVTDPKSDLIQECGTMLKHHGYRIKVFNTINFSKSHHYNPMKYVHSERDILKLVTALIANTKGDQKRGDPFWEKETLLLTVPIAYLHYEAPESEQNFSTVAEMIGSMEVQEDDEAFRNIVDLMFDALEEKDPEHFAVRQYRKFRLAAGGAVLSLSLAPFASWLCYTVS